MPRTKVSKSTKRFRETSSCEEKLREFEASCDGYMYTLEKEGRLHIKAIEEKLYVLLMGTDSNLLQLLMGDILSMNLTNLEDCKKFVNSLAVTSSGGLKPTSSRLNPNDEGYLTEDSSAGGSSIGVSASVLTAYSQSSAKHQTQRGRTPGPLNSARARRPRRSRSVNDDLVRASTVKSNSSADTHASRSKMRTPTAARSKAFSADRSSQFTGSQQCSAASTYPQSPATGFLRWPKPGEVVLSKCGSPVVSQVMPDKYINMNIPTRNGVFYIRPKKLEDLKSDIIEAIDQDTLNQLRTMSANLNLIMKLADNSTSK